MNLVFAVYMAEQAFIVFAMDKFMKVFFEKRRTPFYIYALSYAVYLTGTVSAFYFLKIPLVNLLCSTAGIFLVTLNHESPVKRKITAVCVIYAFLFITDIFVASLSGFVFSSPVAETDYDAVFGYVAIGLLFYLEAVLAQNFRNIRKESPVSGLYWFSTFAVPLLSVYIAVQLLEAENTGHAELIASIAAIFLLNVLTFYLYDSLSAAYTHRLDAEIYEKEREYYYSQCVLMRESAEDLRAFRHDIKNNLSVLDSYIRQNRTREAEEYLQRLIGGVSDGTDYSVTGNIAFDSIINYKLRKAEENNAEIQVNISVPQGMGIDAADAVAILGNLLDNALDAVSGTGAGRIRLDVEYSKGRVLIYLENTFDGRIDCRNGEFVSVKSGSGHGYGLRNVRRALGKYKGSMDIKYTDTVFSVDILMYAGAGQEKKD